MNLRHADAPALLDLLAQWVDFGWLRALDLALARFLAEEIPNAPPALLLAAALTSHQLGHGHVCLDLSATLADPHGALALPPDHDRPPDEVPPLQPRDLLAGWPLADWLAALDHPALVGDGTTPTPLVRVGHRLYLYRYWRYERQVEAALRQRLQPLAATPALPAVDHRPRLDLLFPPGSTPGTDWQKVACALALRAPFCLITGGPGTGKTTTVVRLLALLQSSALDTAGGRPLRIRLAAPTGKAAARLKASISGALHALPARLREQPTLLASLPSEVTTLHRLLGPRPDRRAFRHDARQPLALDVLVIDEGSMVDLEMMAAVLQALPAHARLVLLGDKDQLASVEAGAVLGVLCQRADGGHFTPDTAAWIEAMTGETLPPALCDPAGRPFDQQVVMLRDSRRFAADSGIGRLAAAVNAGDTSSVRTLWQAPPPDLRLCALSDPDDPALGRLLLGPPDDDRPPLGLAAYLHQMAASRPPLTADAATWAAWARAVLATHARFQLLCALRSGPWGVHGLNAQIERLLGRAGLIRPDAPWYEGRPVLVTRNDYRLGLMNGDIGLTLACPTPDPAGGAPTLRLRVAFPDPEAEHGLRWVLPSRLQAVETVYALTVHKSQGSEFEHCALLLPPAPHPILTRELIYTAITRSRTWFTLIGQGPERVLASAIARTVQRASGLAVD